MRKFIICRPAAAATLDPGGEEDDTANALVPASTLDAFCDGDEVVAAFVVAAAESPVCCCSDPCCCCCCGCTLAVAVDDNSASLVWLRSVGPVFVVDSDFESARQ